MKDKADRVVLIGDFYTHKDIKDVLLDNGLFLDGDLKILNFEGSYSSTQDTDLYARIKNGPSLLQGSDAKRVVELLGIDLIVGANNHYLDFKTHPNWDIPVVFNFQEVNIGKGVIRFWFLTERVYFDSELSVNLYKIFDDDLLNDYKQMDRQEHVFDVLIVHSGIEGLPITSEVFRFLAHRYVDLGFSAVIFNHNHVISPIERYNGATICYGTGSFFMSNLGLESKSLLTYFQLNDSGLSIDFVEIIAKLVDKKLAIELTTVESDIHEQCNNYEDSLHLNKGFKELFFYYHIKNLRFISIFTILVYCFKELFRRVVVILKLRKSNAAYSGSIQAFGENVVNYLKLHAVWKR